MTTFRTRLLAVLAAAGTLAGGAALASPSPAAAQPRAANAPHHIRIVTLSAAGMRIAVHKGNRLRLDLRTASDGGYAWSFTHRPKKSVIRVIGKTRKPYKHGKHEVGYPYHTFYLLKPESFGTTTVELIERQPFDHKHVARHFTLTIHVPHRPAR